MLSGSGGGAAPIRIEVDTDILRQAGKGLSVGRSEELADFTVADEQISRRHLRISLQQTQIMVEDLNSSNGSYINGQLLPAFKPRALHIGDKIKLGETEMSVSAA